MLTQGINRGMTTNGRSSFVRVAASYVNQEANRMRPLKKKKERGGGGGKGRRGKRTVPSPQPSPDRLVSLGEGRGGSCCTVVHAGGCRRPRSVGRGGREKRRPVSDDGQQGRAPFRLPSRRCPLLGQSAPAHAAPYVEVVLPRAATLGDVTGDVGSTPRALEPTGAPPADTGGGDPL